MFLHYFFFIDLLVLCVVVMVCQIIVLWHFGKSFVRDFKNQLLSLTARDGVLSLLVVNSIFVLIRTSLWCIENLI